MRLLVLGGTRFLGRAVVEAALADGHEVTLFNRGRTNPELFPGVGRIVGDRTGDLSDLGGRSWDAVIDVACYFPADVRRSVRALAGTGRYVFVSSISVYADVSLPPAENEAVIELAPGAETDDGAETYGGRKAACERVVAEAFGDRALVVRPGLIVGPYDPTGRFTYWPHRVAAGGEVLAPGSPRDLVQFIDVRDLGEWLVRASAAGLGGTFNATGEPVPFGELLEECRRVSSSDADFTWLASERVLAEGVEPWLGLPLWLPGEEYAGLQRTPVERAKAAGLAFRPLRDTIAATLAEAERVHGVGLTAERERELLEDARRSA